MKYTGIPVSLNIHKQIPEVAIRRYDSMLQKGFENNSCKLSVKKSMTQ